MIKRHLLSTMFALVLTSSAHAADVKVINDDAWFAEGPIWYQDKLYYVADVPDNKGLVYFEISEVTKDGFVCENPMHDFPKKLVYQLNGSRLSARISGGDKVIDYLFERKTP